MTDKVQLVQGEIDPRDLTSYKSWHDLPEERRKDIDENFAYCLEYNPGPFTLDQVARAFVIHEGEDNGKPWLWEVFLQDFHTRPWVYYVIGECDYTGWDCQSSAHYVAQS